MVELELAPGRATVAEGPDEGAAPIQDRRDVARRERVTQEGLRVAELVMGRLGQWNLKQEMLFGLGLRLLWEVVNLPQLR